MRISYLFAKNKTDKMQSEFYNITKINVEYIMNQLNEDKCNGGGIKP